MAKIQLSIDDTLRDDAQTVAEQLGLDLSTAVRMFLVQMVRRGGLPFQLKADPFYSPTNQRHLKHAAKEFQEGKNIVYHDLLEA